LNFDGKNGEDDGDDEDEEDDAEETTAEGQPDAAHRARPARTRAVAVPRAAPRKPPTCPSSPTS
jgi:hypothetical protein